MDEGTEFWRRADLVDTYDRTDLRPVEVVLLERYRQTLSGRVLELGVGAGRVTRHLCGLARELHGIDISPAMVERARTVCPRATIDVRDLRDLSVYGNASFDAVVAPFNVIDILDNQSREAVLDEIGRILVPGGILVFSSHNLAFAPSVHGPVRQVVEDLRAGRLKRAAVGVVRLPRRMANHARQRRLERREAAYAILNDTAHDYAISQYYISRDEQERQLARHGLRLIESLDLAGSLVAAGAAAAISSELHYVATLPL
jgi:SAM-dependent methyltransferase